MNYVIVLYRETDQRMSQSCVKSKYWKTKPVMKLDERSYVSQQIADDQDLQKYKKDQNTQLPSGYEWNKVDICDNQGMNSICDFLNKHYKRGTESVYIIQYDADRLCWEMSNTGYFLTVSDSQKHIVGVIGFTFRTVQIHEQKHTMAEPMYMCCDMKYRNKGIAKVLMDETIRQSLLLGINKGVFCDNRIVPKPICTLRQYSRPLNYKKLRENDFVSVEGVDDDLVHNRAKINLKPNKKYVLAEKTEENINIVHDLYCKYMKTFSLHMVLTKKDIENYMFNEKYAKTVLIMSDDDTSKPVDFVTYNFYDIVNTKNNNDNAVIKTANLLMYSSNVVRPDLIFINILKQISYDKIHIVYVMDMMHNNEFILSNVKNSDEVTDDEEQHATYDMGIMKTGKKLYINLFNWKCDSFQQNMVSWLTF